MNSNILYVFCIKNDWFFYCMKTTGTLYVLIYPFHVNPYFEWLQYIVTRIADIFSPFLLPILFQIFIYLCMYLVVVAMFPPFSFKTFFISFIFFSFKLSLFRVFSCLSISLFCWWGGVEVIGVFLYRQLIDSDS